MTSMNRCLTRLVGGVAVLGLLLLGGCAGMPERSSQPASDPVQAAQGKTRQQLHTDLVRAMLAKGSYHAALANIEELEREGDTSPEVELLHADTLARLGRIDAAKTRYQSLLSGPMDTGARHGLGRLLAQSDHSQALGYLQGAVSEQPTNPALRNDYGYALLLGGCYDQALQQLNTAHELAPGNDTYRNNELLVLLANGRVGEFNSRTSAWNLSPEAIASLQKRARQWRQQAPANAECSSARQTASGTTTQTS